MPLATRTAATAGRYAVGATYRPTVGEVVSMSAQGLYSLHLRV